MSLSASRCSQFVSVVLLWQLMISKCNGFANEASKVFQKYHSAVISVRTDTGHSGTAFCIDPQEHVIGKQQQNTRREVRYVITAFHVVKGASKINVYIYLDKNNADGSCKVQTCQAEISRLDVQRNVAVLSIPCHTCDCKALRSLQPSDYVVKQGDTVFVIGDLGKRRYHTFATGTVSDVRYPTSLMSYIYKDKRGLPEAMTYGITGSFSHGDSGSAVMSTDGYVIGMISAKAGDIFRCVTMTELSKAYEKIRENMKPKFVGCTSHKSTLLGKLYWGGTSGKSRIEMYSIATAIQTPYFAVAHNGSEAHAFTFFALWWDIFPQSNHLKEDSTQCMCKLGSFTDIIHDQDGIERCGCADDACRKKKFYHKRSGEDNDRRWAIYKLTNTHYVPNQVFIAMMNDLVKEIEYWTPQQRDGHENRRISNYEINLGYGTIVALLVCLGFGIIISKLYKERNDLKEQITRLQGELLQETSETF